MSDTKTSAKSARASRDASKSWTDEERDAMKRAIAEEPVWARELEVLRDEPELFEVCFVRVR